MDSEPEKSTNRMPVQGAESHELAASPRTPAVSPEPAASMPAQSAPAQPRYVVVDRSFGSLCGFFYAMFVAFCTFGACVLTILAVSDCDAEYRYSVPVELKYLTGNRYELLTHGSSPGEGLFSVPDYTYMLVRTDADVTTRMEHLNALNFKFIPLESPELDSRRGPIVYYDIPPRTQDGHYQFKSDDLLFPTVEKIREVFEPILKTPLGADCRVYHHLDAPDDIYVCWSPESKLLLIIKD